MRINSRYHRCNFCEHRNPYAITCGNINRDSEGFLCSNYEYFSLDAEKVVEEAKRLGVSVHDVLEMISLSAKLNERKKTSLMEDMINEAHIQTNA